MSARAPALAAHGHAELQRLGERLRQHRKRQKVTAVAAAEAAGISRVTLHRIERGEASVAMAAWMALSLALGVTFDVVDPAAAPEATPELPSRIRLDEYPQLKALGWQLKGTLELTPQQALDLYERNWRHVDTARLEPNETSLIRSLSKRFGGGRLLV